MTEGSLGGARMKRYSDDFKRPGRKKKISVFIRKEGKEGEKPPKNFFYGNYLPFLEDTESNYLSINEKEISVQKGKDEGFFKVVNDGLRTFLGEDGETDIEILDENYSYHLETKHKTQGEIANAIVPVSVRFGEFREGSYVLDELISKVENNQLVTTGVKTADFLSFLEKIKGRLVEKENEGAFFNYLVYKHKLPDESVYTINVSKEVKFKQSGGDNIYRVMIPLEHFESHLYQTWGPDFASGYSEDQSINTPAKEDIKKPAAPVQKKKVEETSSSTTTTKKKTTTKTKKTTENKGNKPKKEARFPSDFDTVNQYNYSRSGRGIIVSFNKGGEKYRFTYQLKLDDASKMLVPATPEDLTLPLSEIDEEATRELVKNYLDVANKAIYQIFSGEVPKDIQLFDVEHKYEINWKRGIIESDLDKSGGDFFPRKKEKKLGTKRLSESELLEKMIERYTQDIEKSEKELDKLGYSGKPEDYNAYLDRSKEVKQEGDADPLIKTHRKFTNQKYLLQALKTLKKHVDSKEEELGEFLETEYYIKIPGWKNVPKESPERYTTYRTMGTLLFKFKQNEDTLQVKIPLEQFLSGFSKYFSSKETPKDLIYRPPETKPQEKVEEKPKTKEKEIKTKTEELPETYVEVGKDIQKEHETSEEVVMQITPIYEDETKEGEGDQTYAPKIEDKEKTTPPEVNKYQAIPYLDTLSGKDHEGVAKDKKEKIRIEAVSNDDEEETLEVAKTVSGASLIPHLDAPNDKDNDSNGEGGDTDLAQTLRTTGMFPPQEPEKIKPNPKRAYQLLRGDRFTKKERQKYLPEPTEAEEVIFDGNPLVDKDKFLNQKLDEKYSDIVSEMFWDLKKTYLYIMNGLDERLVFDENAKDPVLKTSPGTISLSYWIDRASRNGLPFKIKRDKFEELKTAYVALAEVANKKVGTSKKRDIKKERRRLYETKKKIVARGLLNLFVDWMVEDEDQFRNKYLNKLDKKVVNEIGTYLKDQSSYANAKVKSVKSEKLFVGNQASPYTLKLEGLEIQNKELRNKREKKREKGKKSKVDKLSAQIKDNEAKQKTLKDKIRERGTPYVKRKQRADKHLKKLLSGKKLGLEGSYVWKPGEFDKQSNKYSIVGEKGAEVYMEFAKDASEETRTEKALEAIFKTIGYSGAVGGFKYLENYHSAKLKKKHKDKPIKELIRKADDKKYTKDEGLHVLYAISAGILFPFIFAGREMYKSIKRYRGRKNQERQAMWSY